MARAPYQTKIDPDVTSTVYRTGRTVTVICKVDDTNLPSRSVQFS